MMKSRPIIATFSASALIVIIGTILGVVGLPQNVEGSLVFKISGMGENEGLLGGNGTFLGIAGVAAITLVINFFLAREIYGRERFLAHIIAAATAAYSIFFLAASVYISKFN